MEKSSRTRRRQRRYWQSQTKPFPVRHTPCPVEVRIEKKAGLAILEYETHENNSDWLKIPASMFLASHWPFCIQTIFCQLVTCWYFFFRVQVKWAPNRHIRMKFWKGNSLKPFLFDWQWVMEDTPDLNQLSVE